MVECVFECRWCDTTETLTVDIDQYQRWNAREILVQDAFPHLSAPQRELIMSGTCSECWVGMFGYDDEEEVA